MRLPAVLAMLALLVAPAAAQAPKLDDVVAGVRNYILGYEAQLASVVAEETYTQTIDSGSGAPSSTGGPGGRSAETYGPGDRPSSTTLRSGRTRTLRSDYALTRAGGPDAWVGFRDTFEVDGRPVRDREERLERLLTAGDVGQAARIAALNSRYNLGDNLISRNINVPTFAMELLHPRNRERFSHRRSGSDIQDGRPGWVVEFRERGRPTLVRTPEGRDQPSRVVALVDAQAGDVLRTSVSWERVDGSITVTFGRVPPMPVIVPIRMSERYTTRTGVRITGEATYSNYRQFQTSGRLIEPK